MNESIKFIADAKNGRYAEDDTGTMVGLVYTNFSGVTAVVRLTDNSYTTAPLAHIEYVAAES